MIRKYTLLFAMCLLAVAARAQRAVITGTADSLAEHSMVYVADMQGFFSFIPEDSAEVVGGRFTITSDRPQPALRYLLAVNSADDKDVRIMPFIIANRPITVTMARRGRDRAIDGGRDNELLTQYYAEQDRASELMNPVWEASRDTTLTADARKAAKERLQQMEDSVTKAGNQFIADNIPSGFSSVMLAGSYQSMPEAQLTAILEKMGRLCPDDPTYKAITAEREAQKRTAQGQHFTDIALPQPDGKTLRLADVVAKSRLTLVDFWASWCGPCRAEMPNVVKLYAKYQPKGLAIVGVSLDSKKEAWTAAIAKLGMTWPQMSDLKGWNCAGSRAYNVSAIPATVLIDQQGTIIARDLRGPELEAKVEEILK